MHDLANISRDLFTFKFSLNPIHLLRTNIDFNSHNLKLKVLCLHEMSPLAYVKQ